MARDPWALPGLDTEHAYDLQQSAISPAVAKARGYTSVHKTVDVGGLGFQNYQAPTSRMPGLLIPMFRPGTTGSPSGHQLKMETPRKTRGRDVKYETPAGLPNILDMNPSVAAEAGDPARRLWIVEGVKKGDCLVSHGEVAVAIAGVWAWRGTNSSGGKTRLAAFDDLALNGREVIVCFDSDATEKTQVRNAMERLVHYLRARGAEAKFLVVPAPLSGAKQGADDFLMDPDHTVEGLASFAVDELPVEDEERELPQYDEVVDALGYYRFVLDWGRWIRWDGRRWEEDTSSGHLVEGAILSIIDPLREMVLLPRSSSLMQATALRRAMERDAAGFHVYSSMINARPHLLNVANGTVNLRTGVLEPHDPENMLTTITAGAYRPAHRDVDVSKVVRDLVPTDCVDYLQRVFGYAMTGSVTEEIFIVLGGRGSNGKTTLLGVANKALGDYAMAANTKLIMAGNNEHATIEADLFGRRLVYLSETGEGGELAIERVKGLTGGDVRRARRMREDFWEFEPSHTLMLATNHLPVVGSTDYGTWRRMRLIPFPYRFVDKVKFENDRVGDAGVRVRAMSSPAAWDAFVTWCVDGAVAYFHEGLRNVPVSVQEATDEWRVASDPFGAFVKDACIIEFGERMEQAKLTAAYNEHLRALGHTGKVSTPWVKAQLTSLGQDIGFKVSEKRADGERWLIGIRLVKDGEQPRITVPANAKPNPESDGDPWYKGLRDVLGLDPE